ncbi:MAG: type II toxin-antitoxin system RelE/ParE family toxin [bacterium]|nr:type II toxin-antitoxin system RelE/ParE family toxin [bacterium]
MRNIFATPQFKKDLAEVNKDIFAKAEMVLSVLKLNLTDISLKLKKLKIGTNLWRVRVGTHRLIYSFNKDSIILLRIRHRKDVYKGLK